MTCIVGIVERDQVVIAGDSAGVAGWHLTVRADEKVFKNGRCIMGFTSSFRMGQLLRHAFTVPDHDPRLDVDKFMVTIFVDAVRKCLKDGGFAKKNNDVEEGGTFLVGYCGRLYQIEDDYQVARPADDYAAVGCGAATALGSLHATQGMPAKERVIKALQAAERFSAGVRGPFVTVSQDTELGAKRKRGLGR